MTAAEALESAAHYLQHGRPDQAGLLLNHAIQDFPTDAGLRVALALAFARQGRRHEALPHLHEALRLNPQFPNAWENLGHLHRELGQAPEALSAYKRAAELQPDDPGALHRLASMLVETCQYSEAIDLFQRALKIRPDFYPALHNLALAFQRSGKLEESVATFQRAITLHPQLAELHNRLGSAWLESRRFDEAAAAFSRAIQLRPDLADAHFNLGFVFQHTERLDQAIASYRTALSINPQFKEALLNLGNSFKDSGRVDEAIACYRQCLAMGFDSFEVHANLGAALRTAGDLTAAIQSLHRASDLNPCSAAAQNLLYTIHLHPDYGPERIQEEHEKWNRTCAAPLARFIRPHANDRSPDRRLKIGYVSPDFRRHPVGTLILPVLAHHDHTQVEVFCYSNVARPDPLTAQTRHHADQWRDCLSHSDEQLADLIGTDGIDILIDLALHTEDSRLLTFARKPAPVQATWLGYPSTTGLSAIDYRFSDPYLDPPEEDRAAFYSERTVLLDSFWCYDPALQIPLTDRPPVEQNGFITFGCLNNSAKITDITLSLWATVMRAVEGSRLLLLVPPVARPRLLSTMQTLGVDSAHIHCTDRFARDQYFEAYNRIDICLDTFPYTGHTTTLDAVWMGCPVVTLTGQTAVSRGSASILSNAGFPELIATSPRQLVQVTQNLASDRARLQSIRPALRRGLESSIVMDKAGFTRRLETVYRNLWRNYCQTP